MPQFQIRCPQCRKAVRATVNNQQEVAQLACSECGASIKFRVPKPGSPQPQRTTPNAPPEDPLAIFSSTSAPSTPVRNSGPRGEVPYQGAGNPYGRTAVRPAKSNSIFLIVAGVVVAGMLALGVLGVGIYFYFWASTSTPTNAQQSGTGTSINANNQTASNSELPKSKNPLPKIPRPESAVAIGKENESLREQADRSVASITDADRHTTGADLLTEFAPKFAALFYRAVQAKPESLIMNDVAQRDAKMAAEIARLKQSGVINQPGSNYFWTLNSTNDPANRWGAAAYEVTRAKFRTDLALLSRVCLPDPLKETSGAYDWSSEDRRVLSAYWLQGELERDVATELMACIRDKANVLKLRERCFSVMEKFYKPALELSAVKSTQGTMLIDEPKGSPYARHAKATRSVLEDLLEEFPDESIAWVINHTIMFSDAIEDLQFSRTEGVTLFTKYTVQERYDIIQKGLKEERQKQLAEEERIKQERAKAEEARLAKAEADKLEKQRQEAQAKEAAENELAKNSEDKKTDRSPSAPKLGGSRPLGPGAGRPPREFGLPPGDSLPPGARDESVGGSRPGFGPPPGFGENRPTTPPKGPTQMGTSVTIRITGPEDMKVGEFLEKLKTALKTGNFQMSHSGSEATIVLGFDGDLQKVVDAIDFGTAEISDQQKREIRVTID